MKKRLRYYHISHKSDFRESIVKITETPYTEKNGEGFELVELSHSNAVCKFIKRQEVQEEVSFPNGETEVYTRTFFNIFQFEISKISNEALIVRVENPPQSLKYFVAQLSNIFEDFSVEKITFDGYETYTTLIENENITRFTVPRVVVNQIQFTEHSVASIDLRSSDNAMKDLELIYPSKSFSIKKFFIEARINGSLETFEISATGSLCCSEGAVHIMNELALSSKRS